ncbi:hypothetical protein ACQPWW_15235 [Micromonospora sp. CA-240977]
MTRTTRGRRSVRLVAAALAVAAAATDAVVTPRTRTGRQFMTAIS